MAQLSKKARQHEVDRLRQVPGTTQEDIARQLHVDVRTIKRDYSELDAQGKKAKRQLVLQDDRLRDAALDTHETTMAEIRWAIKQLRDGVEAVNDAVMEKVQDGTIDGVLLSSWAKMYDSLTNQLTLKAKVAGEITDAPQLSIVQIDTDVQDTIALVQEFSHCPNCGHELNVGRFLYNRLLGKYPRRRGRWPEYYQLLQMIDSGQVTAEQADDAIEGDFREV
jgi:hypothetical protein